MESVPPSPIACPFGRIALVLQGGGALGAYQAGVYQALHEVGLEPHWLAGVSIGALHPAVIAGHRAVPNVRGLGSLLDSATPLLGLGVPPLLLGAPLCPAPCNERDHRDRDHDDDN